MRKAITAFEQEFAQWGLTLPAQDVVDRQGGHQERHGWVLDYSFGSDAFGEYLEYHARRSVPGETVVERHARVYANGERNFVPAPHAPAPPAEPPGAEAAAPSQPAPGAKPKRPTLPPWEAIISEATGSHREPEADDAPDAPMRQAARASAPPRPPSRAASRSAPRPAARPARRESSSVRRAGGSGYYTAAPARQRRLVTSLLTGAGAAVVVAALILGAAKLFGARHEASNGAVPADSTAELSPVIVYAPAVLSFQVDTSTPRLTQPLVGTRGDPNRAEIVRPDHGMTPIIPSDPKGSKKTRPAPTTRGEKFHVP